MKYSTAAVTGSSGFVGKNLVGVLRSKGISVLEISRTASSVDVTNWDQVQKVPVIALLVEGFDIDQAFAFINGDLG